MVSFYMITGWVLIVLIIVFFFILAWRSNLLRDNINDPQSFRVAASLMSAYTQADLKDIPLPFSLARTQLATWTVVIACSYIYLTLCQNCMPDIAKSTTTLILLGISAGTSGLANVIDQYQSNQPGYQPRHQNQPSKGFLTDILSDDNGVSVHRFQNVIWTVVAILVYLSRIRVGDCSLPELEGTILVLTGISNSAYLALKVNENNRSKTKGAA